MNASPIFRRRANVLFALLLSLSLSLSGCNSDSTGASNTAASAPRAQSTQAGEDPSDSSSEPPSPPAHDDHRPVLDCFGDSLTAGHGTDPGQSYPDDLQRDLDHLGYAYRVVNSGVSGDTTKDGLARLKDVLALKPAVVIVAFGGNDGLRGLPIADSRANLGLLISTLQQSGAKVVLGGITLPPNYGADYIRQFDQTYVLLAKQYHVPLMPFILQGVYGVPGSMQGDGIHATAQGNQQVALNLLPLVKPLLRK